MENQNKHHLSNFWSGFALGVGAATLAAFLFGTKKGRKTLKQLLELSENIEENFLEVVEEVGQELPPIKQFQKEHPTLNRLLDKISSLAPQAEKKVKRFFVKES
jgi:hypothetical protein